MLSNTVPVTGPHSCRRQYCTAPLPQKVALWSSHSPVFCAQIWWANWRLSPCFGQWDSFRVPPDCAVLLLVTVWRWVFDCGSLEWISGDKALVPVRGSHSGPCLLSHFPDKPNCISQECPGPNSCPAWPLRCLGPVVIDPHVNSLPCCCPVWVTDLFFKASAMKPGCNVD